MGLHPFYAIVTSGAGSQYRTQTTWIRLIGPEPPITLSAQHPPLMLLWPATAGRSYEVLSATNVLGPFTIAATLIPSNSSGAWIDTNTSSGAKYYRLQTSY